MNVAACGVSLWTDPVIAATFPVEEADYIQQRPKIKKLGNTYDTGGYLLYRLWPTTQVMIDPRGFPFKAWIEQYMCFENGQNIQQFVAEHKVDAWFIPHDRTQLMQWFIMHQPNTWIPAFFGPVGVVFVLAESMADRQELDSDFTHTVAPATLAYAFDTAILLKNWPLAARIQARAAALAATCPICRHHSILAQNMSNAIIGARAFWSGDYVTAAAYLRKDRFFIHTKDLGIAALRILGKRAWDSDDYALARTEAMEVLKLNRTDAIDIYNAAIADWQYQQSIFAKQIYSRDNITWQFLAALVLSQQNKISQSEHFIIEVLTAMQRGTLVTKPGFVIKQ